MIVLFDVVVVVVLFVVSNFFYCVMVRNASTNAISKGGKSREREEKEFSFQLSRKAVDASEIENFIRVET
jgi:hypothetical protein